MATLSYSVSPYESSLIIVSSVLFSAVVVSIYSTNSTFVSSVGASSLPTSYDYSGVEAIVASEAIATAAASASAFYFSSSYLSFSYCLFLVYSTSTSFLILSIKFFFFSLIHYLILEALSHRFDI
jgi:hypothetical protein